MLSVSAFRYYKKNYDLFSQFNKGLSPVKYRTILVVFFLLYVSGIALIAKFFMKTKVLNKKLKGENIVSFVFSINQHIIHKALARLGLSYNEYNFTNKGADASKTNCFSDRFVFFCSVGNAKLVYRELKSAKEDEVLYNNSIRIVKLCGLEFIYNLLLEDVKVVIHYNDHTSYSVLLHDIAASKNIKTVYIQHAPVSDRFPALYNDLNVLFSEDSVHKYKAENESVKKFVLFDVRFVAWDDYDNSTGDCVLICPNKLDDINIVKDFARKLSECYQVIVRPHPADSRPWDDGGSYRVSEKTSIWTDIQQSKYVVTNESAVILEALYAGRLCYKCAFFSTSFDNYGFLKNGLLLHEYTEFDTVISDIKAQKISYNRKKFAYFAGDIDARDQKIKSLEHEILHLGD